MYNPPKFNKELRRAASRRAYLRKKAAEAAAKEISRHNRLRIAEAINQYEKQLSEQN